MDILAEQRVNQRRRSPCTRGKKICLMVSPNDGSSVILTVVFDLPVAVQPPVERGERRDRRGRVRTSESERLEGAMRGFMARFLETPQRLLLFSTRASPLPPRARFWLHLSYFENRVVQEIFISVAYQTPILKALQPTNHVLCILEA
jgi:hypothetical protein